MSTSSASGNTATVHVLVCFFPVESVTGTYWKPVVEFEAEGQKYRLEYENGMDRDRFPVGMAVDILYAVSDPSRFHLADDPVFLDPGGGAIRISIIWIVVSAALAIALAVFVGGARPDLHRLWHVFQGVVRSR